VSFHYVLTLFLFTVIKRVPTLGVGKVPSSSRLAIGMLA
jgi:hypothetical protein